MLEKDSEVINLSLAVCKTAQAVLGQLYSTQKYRGEGESRLFQHCLEKRIFFLDGLNIVLTNLKQTMRCQLLRMHQWAYLNEIKKQTDKDLCFIKKCAARKCYLFLNIVYIFFYHSLSNL